MGKWVKDRLDSLGDIVAGGTPSTNVDAYWDGEIPFVTPYDLSKCAGVWIDKTARYITKAGLKNSAANLLPPQSIVISTRAPIGYIALTLEPSVSNQGCKSVVLKEDQDKVFHCYNLSAYVGEMKRLGVGTTFSEISKADLSRIKVCHPVSLDEQRHIAEILTTCDEVIEKSEAVAEKYRAIKAGMLKDLFTRGIGRNGKLRPTPESAPQHYKDTALGKVPREWEVKRLGSVCFPPQYGLNVAAVKYDGKHGYLRITDIDDESHLFIRQGITSPSMYEEIYRAQEGDVFFARTGASTGKTYLYRAEDGELYFAGFLIKFHCKERVNSAYVFYQTLTTRYMNWVSAVSTRTGQPGINSQELSTFRMAIPSDPAEQRQIAERLSAIDAKIADELAVIAKYRKVKAGLMARLLTPPNMEVE